MTAVLPDAQQTFWVTPLNGHRMEVQSSEEVAFFEAEKRGYLSENTFTSTSDAADLDRLLGLEVQMFRAERFLLSGYDHEGHAITATRAVDLRRQQRYLSGMITEIKQALGLSKDAREKAEHESVGAYLVGLRARAKAQGIKRERELDKALVLMHDLLSLVDTFDRANEHERRKLGLDSEADIVALIRDRIAPEFREIDEYFRKHDQSTWVGTL
jgi:hypothetical protein